eukprot:418503-Amorphochlora_amoeboformis.AAC.1
MKEHKSQQAPNHQMHNTRNKARITSHNTPDFMSLESTAKFEWRGSCEAFTALTVVRVWVWVGVGVRIWAWIVDGTRSKELERRAQILAPENS